MDAISEFTKEIDSFIDCWQSVEIKCVCLVNDGHAIAIDTKICLLSESLPETQACTLRTANICVYTKTASIPTLDTMLQEVSKGLMQFNDEIVYLAAKQNESSTIKPNFSFYSSAERSLPSWVSASYHDAYFALFANTGSIFHELDNPPSLESISNELRCLDPPYDGLTDLLASEIGDDRPSDATEQDLGRITILAPLEISFDDECSLIDEQLTVSIKCAANFSIKDISVGVVIRNGNKVTDRLTVRGEDFVRSVMWNGIELSCVVGAPHSTNASIFVRYRNKLLTTNYELAPPNINNNPRLGAYSYFDTDFQLLNTYLGGEGKHSADDFESGIAALLHFCGFNTFHYGAMKRIPDEIDLIGFNPFNQDIITVECTLKDINVNNKLSKLARRSKELAEAIPDCTIHPMLFTALEKEKISKTDYEQAESESILVISRELIYQFLDEAGEDPTPMVITDYLQAWAANRQSRLYRNVDL